MNFVFEPTPAGAMPGRATGSTFWLIDHGLCGLFPAGKFDPACAPHDVPDNPASVASGTLRKEAEQFIATVMPPEYRMALKNAQGDDRTALLDRLRAVGDHARVRPHTTARELVIEVHDDGVGGARPHGSGLVGLAERVAAFGGRLRVDSPPGRGTLISGVIPIS
jgi:hypothetical protein